VFGKYGELEPVTGSMSQAGRREVEDLQRWIRSHPAILGEDLAIIGEQIPTKTGLMDFLAIDRAGNLVVVELKRDRLPREVLAQAVDYASDVAGWDADKVSEVCVKFGDQTVQDLLNEGFGDIDLGDLIINKVQRT
jgi:RecB family endonuclease NucS